MVFFLADAKALQLGTLGSNWSFRMASQMHLATWPEAHQGKKVRMRSAVDRMSECLPDGMPDTMSDRTRECCQIENQTIFSREYMPDRMPDGMP